MKGPRIVRKVELIRQLGPNRLELLSLFHFFERRLGRVWNNSGRPRLGLDFDWLHFHFSENFVIYLWLWFTSLQKRKYSWSTRMMPCVCLTRFFCLLRLKSWSNGNEVFFVREIWVVLFVIFWNMYGWKYM